MKHKIWDNDASKLCDIIAAEPEEFGLEHPSEDEIWDAAYEEINNTLGDEVLNCNVYKPSEIFAIGTIQRWDGDHAAYKALNTRCIGEAFEKVLGSFGGDNSFEIYEEDGRLYLSQTGHDNPTNPSIIELRVCNETTLDDLIYEHGDSTDTLMKFSEPLGQDICNVYGWEYKEVS